MINGPMFKRKFPGRVGVYKKQSKVVVINGNRTFRIKRKKIPKKSTGVVKPYFNTLGMKKRIKIYRKLEKTRSRKSILINQNYDVLVQPLIKRFKWLIVKIGNDYIRKRKEKIYEEFHKKIKKTKEKFYEKPQVYRKYNYKNFYKKKDEIFHEKNTFVTELMKNIPNFPKAIFLIIYSLLKKRSTNVLKKRIKRFLKNLVKKISEVFLALFNFNTSSSAYVVASLSKRRFELKFARKETSMMLINTVRRYAKGFLLTLPGRYTKNIMATIEEYKFGESVHPNSIMSATDYHQTTAIIRYGASSQKVFLSYSNFSLMGAFNFYHRKTFKFYKNKNMSKRKKYKFIIKKFLTRRGGLFKSELFRNSGREKSRRIIKKRNSNLLIFYV